MEALGPLALLRCHREAFGHRPQDSDPPPLRRLQQLTELWTWAAGAIPPSQLLAALEAYAELVAECLTLSEHAAAHRSLALMQLDMELFPFQADFMALDSAARREAWCARVPDANRMPGWCSEGVISQFQQPMEVPR